MSHLPTPVKLEFGKSQMLTSGRMKRFPFLSKMIYAVFGYTSVGNWARSLVVIQLFKKLPLRQFNKIMDLGAGLGEFSFMLSKALPQANITSLEIWKERAGILKETVSKGGYENVRVYSDKIETLEENNSFDFIFAIDVFEHIFENEMPFSSCRDKLKENGYLLVKIPNVDQISVFPDAWFKEHQDWLDDEHVGQVYDLEGLAERFRKEGFEIVHQSYSDGWFSRLAWEIGYLAHKGGAPVQLAFLPLCKLLVRVDRLFSKTLKKGNAIQVIGQKISL